MNKNIKKTVIVSKDLKGDDNISLILSSSGCLQIRLASCGLIQELSINDSNNFHKELTELMKELDSSKKNLGIKQ